MRADDVGRLKCGDKRFVPGASAVVILPGSAGCKTEGWDAVWKYAAVQKDRKKNSAFVRYKSIERKFKNEL